MRASIRRFFSDRSGRLVVAQRPNAPLLVWAALALAAWLTRGEWSDYLYFLSATALVTWAYLEITQGDSPFRRVLGAGVLVFVVLQRLPQA